MYANANPTRFLDPTGHANEDENDRAPAPTPTAGPAPPRNPEEVRREELDKKYPQGTISPIEGSSARGALYYTASQVLPGSDDPKTSAHPFVEAGQMGADYRTFVREHETAATLIGVGTALLSPGKVLKVAGMTGAMAEHYERVGGSQPPADGIVEEPSPAESPAHVDPLPAQKEQDRRQAEGAMVAGALQPAPQQYRGGPHRKMKGPTGDQLASHHMPAKSVSPLQPDDGPAIQMETPDHEKTSSWGTSREAAEYRAEIKELVDKGEWRKAMAKEIKDVRRVAGTKYNAAVREMLEYAKALGKLGKAK